MKLRTLLLIASFSHLVLSQTISKNPLTAMSTEIRALTRQASRAVVEIQVTSYGSGVDGGAVSRQQGSGSGVIIDSAGYIVTNAHVVTGAILLRVLLQVPPLAGGEELPATQMDARIVGVDRESDLALLKVEATGLPVLPFAPMGSLRQGDVVLAIGNPMGLRNSVSMGIVSSTARVVSDSSPLAYIQTDASINPGNSGGALVDSEGRLVGINTFILSRSGGSEGLGFAIPSHTVQDVVAQLRKQGHVDRGEAGVILEDITPVLSSALSLPRKLGLIISDVEPESPADKAGLKIGDILLSVNGQRAENVSRFRSYAYSKQGGEKLQIEFQRGKDVQHTVVVLRARRAHFDPLGVLTSPEKHLIPRLGVLGIEIDAQMAPLASQLREPSGVVIAARAAEGLGRLIDLQAGDVIHAINGTVVLSLEFLRGVVKELKPGTAVALQVEREGRMQYVAFEIE